MSARSLYHQFQQHSEKLRFMMKHPLLKLSAASEHYCQIIFKRHLCLQFYQTAYLGCSFRLLSFQRFEQKAEEI